MIEESERLISAQTVDDDPQERAMRPKLLEEYRGQPIVAEQMQIFISAARHSAHRVLARQHWPTSSLTSSASAFARLQGRCLNAPVIWQPCSPISSRMMFFLSMKYTVWARWWRKHCTRQWRIFSSTS